MVVGVVAGVHIDFINERLVGRQRPRLGLFVMRNGWGLLYACNLRWFVFGECDKIKTAALRGRW